jgi:hypothetical protein
MMEMYNKMLVSILRVFPPFIKNSKEQNPSLEANNSSANKEIP